jgi:DNA-directed RNA polymerase beta' subunit
VFDFFIQMLVRQFVQRHAYTFRKEGHTKVIEYDLSSKQKQQNGTLRRPDVLLFQKDDHNYERGRSSIESDHDMSDADSAGDPTFSDDNEEETATPPPSKGQQLPRAANGKLKTSRGRNERVIAPEECRAHLRRLFQKEAIMCSLLFGRHGPFAPISRSGLCFASADMFFLEVIPVAPTRFRPPAKMGDTLFEHPQNELLAKVLHTSYRLRDLHVDLRTASDKKGDVDAATLRKLQASLLEALVQLQVDVNSFMDSSKNPAPIRQGKLPPAGVKQGLEKKEGLFRKHMMVLLTSLMFSTFHMEVSFFPRVNVSIMLLVLSSPRMLTSNQMRSESHPSLPES